MASALARQAAMRIYLDPALIKEQPDCVVLGQSLLVIPVARRDLDLDRRSRMRHR
ncbi:hypothetical protein [Mesorhizobium sp.]|uniref:hypothetical protein n=1 Tax=Mesorhizobium sp. TaxID=1871066 RepID=UPI0025F7FEFB|nr:hypothetical protein [Mesorhizobium sp.]